MPKHPRFAIRRDNRGELRFNLSARNGQVVLSSEGYRSLSSCEKGIAAVLESCTDDSRFDRHTAKNGKHYFVLLAGNRQVIGTSQTYSAKASMENGIRSVRANAPRARVDDECRG
ncbi:MAG TPA: YegP family protein [Thermoanaerobaculia bacterium]|nr:YegP family protein [Thermoanaerobaculia bacterium]